MLKFIKAQCKCCMCSPYFLLCVVLAGLACLFDIALQESADTAVTVLECILSKFTGPEDLTADLSAVELWLQAGDSSFSMLIPILASLPAVVPACLQRKSSNLRFVLPRTGIRGYCLSNLIGSMLVGGFVLALGLLLYGALLLPFFHAAATGYDSILLSAAQKLLGMFLLGCSNGIFSCLLCFFSDNLYLVVCIPFLARYLMSYTIDWLGLLIFGQTNSPLHFLRPGVVQSVAYGAGDGIWALIFIAAAAAISLLIGVQKQTRRFDRGE